MIHRGLRAGFTMIELIIVMAIMGLLIGIAASSFQTSRTKAEDGKRKSDLKQIQTALEAYLNDHGKYPNGANGVIDACGDGTQACPYGSAFTDQNGTVYMAQIPQDPRAPTVQYWYQVSSNNKEYQIFAYLEDVYDSSIIKNLSENCPTNSYKCNYGMSSANTTPTAVLP